MTRLDRLRWKAPRLARVFRREECGAAAVEFALWLTMLTVPVLNVFDLGFYVYEKMQVHHGAAAAAQGVWALCSSSTMWPATDTAKCSNVTTTATTAAQATTLGSRITVSNIQEGYYCATTGGVLQRVGSLGTVGNPPVKQTNCSSVSGSATTTPGDYVLVTVSYTYNPVFRAVSIASALPSPITQTAWTRIGTPS